MPFLLDSVEHLSKGFSSCILAYLCLGVLRRLETSWTCYITYVQHSWDTIVLATIWSIWWECNSRIFEQRQRTPEAIIEKVKVLAQLCDSHLCKPALNVFSFSLFLIFFVALLRYVTITPSLIFLISPCILSLFYINRNGAFKCESQLLSKNYAYKVKYMLGFELRFFHCTARQNLIHILKKWMQLSHAIV